MCIRDRSWTGPEQSVAVDGAAVQVEAYADGFSIVLHRALKPPPGGKDHPLVDRQHLVVQPLHAVIGFSAGIPETLVITNAITDAAIQ